MAKGQIVTSKDGTEFKVTDKGTVEEVKESHFIPDTLEKHVTAVVDTITRSKSK